MFCTYCGNLLNDNANFCDNCGSATNQEAAISPSNPLIAKITDGNNANYFIMVLISCLVSIVLSFMEWFSIPLLGLFGHGGSNSFSVFDALFRFRSLSVLAEEVDSILFGVYVLLLMMVSISAINVIAIYRLAVSKDDDYKITAAYQFARNTGIYSVVLTLLFMVTIFVINEHVASESFGFVRNFLSLGIAP